MTWKNNFAGRLTMIRTQRGLSKSELARRIGIRHVQIVEYEKGHKFPTVDTLVQLAHVLGVSCDWLCGLTADPHPYPPHPGCDPDEQGSTP